MYQVKFYHSGDSDKNGTVLEETRRYANAVKAMKRYANNGMVMGAVIRTRNRIEMRGKGWGWAVYVEKK